MHINAYCQAEKQSIKRVVTYDWGPKQMDGKGQGCQMKGVSKEKDVEAKGCHRKGMSWNAKGKGCQSKGMTKERDVKEKG